MAKTKHIDVNWGREKPQCHSVEGVLSVESEKREKERK